MLSHFHFFTHPVVSLQFAGLAELAAPAVERLHFQFKLDEHVTQLLHRVTVAQCVLRSGTLAEQLHVAQADQLVFDARARQR